MEFPSNLVVAHPFIHCRFAERDDPSGERERETTALLLEPAASGGTYGQRSGEN